MITLAQAAQELLSRRKARRELHEYIKYTNPKYKVSSFSNAVCAALDKFIEDVKAGRRPILVLQAPPQHGKSEIASRKLPAYILGNFPDWRIGAASYSSELANAMAQDVRRNLASADHQLLFPHSKPCEGCGLLRPLKERQKYPCPQCNRDKESKPKYDVDRMGDFNAPGGTGSYLGVGVGSGLTGRPLDIGIIDDPTKDQQEALSPVTKESHWNWYQSVFTTRLSENSGQIIMATSWAEDDLPGRILAQYAGDPRLTHLRFPAINLPDEVGYRADLPSGALVPELKSLALLYEQKKLLSDYWWSAIYQQSAKALGGNVFKESGIQFWLPAVRPVSFDKVIISWDCTFKDTDGTDFVVGQVWGKKGANSYLLDQMRDRMSFTTTLKNVIELRNRWPEARTILIEDKANGPAVIDVLKVNVPGILPVEPDGSKLARAHAVTSYWEAKNIFLPHESLYPWIKQFISELTGFPAAAHDDQVDALTQALRYLYPPFGTIAVSESAIQIALGIVNG